ncbi:spermidine synthase [Aquabacterium sp.]|uniref:spermine/spermidine synthase domain-containing protein n=1 Tax=Aquabacterium sp. TaxID=1872578 RepID=UPI002BC47E6A|nr:spermidine synthase [Aquabacterium sp.]HSW06420.1 spermidine synthase [Aquabacterium sp.]
MKPKKQQALAGATMSEFDGVRYLHLDSPWVQGAMRIRKPRHIELEYVQRMMAWMLWRPTAELSAGHAVQLGLGGAAITRFTHQVLRMKTTAVEINPTVIDACRLWFHLPADDARLSVLQADAGAWVADAANLQSVDVLCVDLYDHDAAAPVLDDEAFYADCRSVLAPGGVMTVNLFGRDASFERSAGHIAAAFGVTQVWQLAPTKEGNTVVVAARDVEVPDRETLTARADFIEVRCELPARKWLRLVRPYRPKEASHATT